MERDWRVLQGQHKRSTVDTAIGKTVLTGIHLLDSKMDSHLLNPASNYRDSKYNRPQICTNLLTLLHMPLNCSSFYLEVSFFV